MADLRTPAARSADAQLERVVAWYFEHAYGRWEGPGTLPYYCDSARVGHFAVQPGELAAGRDAALFRLFVAMAMFQARRDVVIMAQQRGMSRPAARELTSPSRLRSLVVASGCAHLSSATSFDERCDVRKREGVVTCDHLPEAACHVKDASSVLLRTGDMGKLPTSAWLHLWKDGQLARELEAVVAREDAPAARAELLVQRFTRVHRVGRKLATMFVSALSTPALAPGHTPWFPAVDGSALVVVDTHVARAVDRLRGPRAVDTYEARARWLRERAAKLDLRAYRADLPRYCPRLVQQAIYVFCSKSNRVAHGDRCASEACQDCTTRLCPFAGAALRTRRQF